MGWLNSLVARLWGNRKTESAPVDVEQSDDIVTRNGLSYSPAPDPISDAAKAEIERQKDSRRFGAHR
jgi:hypothetical protein